LKRVAPDQQKTVSSFWRGFVSRRASAWTGHALAPDPVPEKGIASGGNAPLGGGCHVH
jgi:hypothetical protein